MLIGVGVLLVESIFLGYRFEFGPFKSLGVLHKGHFPGNQDIYSMELVKKLDDSPLDGKKVCFLGSSVTYGAASIQEGIPEYFEKRFGCSITKEAVNGTTLVDNGKNSYVQRMLNNLNTEEEYDLFVCQLSTNDASRKLPLGVISDGKDLADFDTTTITGAMEYIISYVKTTWDCPVVFYTGSRYESTEYEAMVERLMDLKEKWNIGVLDLWHDDTFNTISDTDRKLYLYDPIHPTKAGYRDWWCPEMEAQLLKMPMSK